MPQDPYVYPGTGVLRNNLEIYDPQELSQAEADIVRAALAVMAGRPLPGSYDLAHWQAFHRRIFGGLYPWAGELRTVQIAKPNACSTLAPSTLRAMRRASSPSLPGRTV